MISSDPVLLICHRDHLKKLSNFEESVQRWNGIRCAASSVLGNGAPSSLAKNFGGNLFFSLRLDAYIFHYLSGRPITLAGVIRGTLP